ncbi:MAG TPA: response regulator transcription factor [Pilimelia sp.]|nr:response regulator transcription factor [Pilimelia sp.]
MDVLLVEDDLRFATALTTALRRHGHRVRHVADGAAALAAPPCDAVLLDLGLPDLDGLDVCARLRERSDVAIIMLTARGAERDRVAGLRCGADDYLVKPFGVAELQARLEAVLRRMRPRPAAACTVGRLTVDVDGRAASVDGAPVPLTRKEFEVLVALARQPGTVVPRERLLSEVWHTSWPGTGRTLDVHMATLRGKLGDAVLVETVRGVGYRLRERPGDPEAVAPEAVGPAGAREARDPVGG